MSTLPILCYLRKFLISCQTYSFSCQENVHDTSPYIIIFKGHKSRKITEKHNISAGNSSLIRLNADYRTRSNYHDSTYNKGIRLSLTFFKSIYNTGGSILFNYEIRKNKVKQNNLIFSKRTLKDIVQRYLSENNRNSTMSSHF